VLLILQPIVLGGASTNPLMLGGWASPLAWFVHSNVHFALAPTREAMEAIAGYLQRRQLFYAAARGEPRRGEEVGAQPRRAGYARGGVVEVGSGSGHFAHLINSTGQLSPRMVATEPYPSGYAQTEAAIYGPGVGGSLCCDVDALDADAAIARHAPSVLLCLFMTAGEDWTSSWRAAGVDEYVLVGDLGSGPLQYSLNREHGDYERVLLEEISAELLDAGLAALEESGGGHDGHGHPGGGYHDGDACGGRGAAKGAGYLVAVSFRKPRPKSLPA